jgi:CubicO group peptidase (beta-lactamase class C family)
MVRVAPFTWPGYTDGSLRTTVTEYGHFLAMLLNQGRYDGVQVLKPETVALILTPQRVPAMPPARSSIVREDYALGWSLHRLAGHRVFMHNGWGTGFATYVYFDPSRVTGGMIFLTGQPAPQVLFPRLERAIERMVTISGQL